MAVVQHDETHHRFSIRDDDDEAYLLYRPRGPGVMEILKVYVPPARREQGIAAVLTERALAYAHENDLEVIPTCSYVRWYMEREQEEANVDR